MVVVFLEFDLQFGINTSLIRRIAREQLILDSCFARDAFALKRKVRYGEISGAEFWESYKKALLKSVSANKDLLKKLFSKTDKEIKERLLLEKNREQQEKRKEPLVDLSVPE